MLSEEQIAQLKQQHGEIYLITVGEKCYFLRKPRQPEIKRFFDTATRSTYDANFTLVASCLLDPSVEDFRKDNEANGSLVIFISAELQEKMAGGQAVSSKNL